MIELKDLTIQKGNIHILKKLNLKFQCGKSYALIGKSGCGKSTLLNTIAGLEKTGKQYVYFNGQLIENNLTAVFNIWIHCCGYFKK